MTDIMPISYSHYDKVSRSRITIGQTPCPLVTVIMIRSAGAELPPGYSDSSLTVKTQCVKQM
jgi:hypothetical protein